MIKYDFNPEFQDPCKRVILGGSVCHPPTFSFIQPYQLGIERVGSGNQTRKRRVTSANISGIATRDFNNRLGKHLEVGIFL
jgi:hypothetical protein